MSSDHTSAPPTGTRADLIGAGLRLFGRDGFAATSTRALAAGAGTNVASIAYHFGSKNGLRLACGAEVMRRIRAVAGDSALPGPIPPTQARARLEAMLRAMIGFMTAAPEAADTVGFILREMAEDSPAAALICDEFFVPKHRQLCALTGMATGRDPEAADTRLMVFSMLGQAVYFRLSQPLICRRMGWQGGYDATATQAITDRLIANLHAILGDVPCPG